MAKIKIPEQIIEIDDKYLSVMAETQNLNIFNISNDEQIYHLITQKIKCEVVIPPKQNFSRQEIGNYAKNNISTFNKYLIIFDYMANRLSFIFFCAIYTSTFFYITDLFTLGKFVCDLSWFTSVVIISYFAEKEYNIQLNIGFFVVVTLFVLTIYWGREMFLIYN